VQEGEAAGDVQRDAVAAVVPAQLPLAVDVRLRVVRRQRAPAGSKRPNVSCLENTDSIAGRDAQLPMA